MKIIKHSIFILTLVLCVQQINAQESKAKTSTDEKKIKENPDGWNLGGTGSLTFNQVGLKNWAAGGDPSISAQAMLNAYADYKFGKHLWQSRLGIEYGQQKIKGQSFRKNSDRLEFFTKYGYAIHKSVYVSAYANVKTLMTPTYEFNASNDKVRMISKFASPMNIESALGIDYVPNQYLSIFASPVASKMIIVADDEIAALDLHGAKGKNFRYELGATVLVTYKQEIFKNTNVQSYLKLYKDYLSGPAQNIDVDWQNTIGLKVNKFLSASVFTHLIWDYDVLIPQFDDGGTQIGTARKLQFKNVIGVGLSYTMAKKIVKTPVEK
jgi:hypothetical protein